MSECDALCCWKRRCVSVHLRHSNDDLDEKNFDEKFISGSGPTSVHHGNHCKYCSV